MISAMMLDFQSTIVCSKHYTSEVIILVSMSSVQRRNSMHFPLSYASIQDNYIFQDEKFQQIQTMVEELSALFLKKKFIKDE